MKVTHVKTGVVVEHEGKFWGIQYGYGYSTAHGYGPVANATVSDPRLCRKPTDLTYKNSFDTEELRKGRLVPIKITTTYEVELP